MPLRTKDRQVLERMTDARRRNNELWMKLVEIAIETKKGRDILSHINDNDKEISQCLSQLSAR